MLLFDRAVQLGRMEKGEKMFVDRLLSEVGTPALSLIPEETFSQLRDSKGFVIWGTGRAAAYAAEECKKHELEPLCVCDSFAHQPGEKAFGYDLLNGNEYLREHSSKLVFVCCDPAYGVGKRLQQARYDTLEWETMLYETFLEDKPLQELLLSEREKVEHVYSLLADERSKQTFENVLKYRLSPNRQLLKSVIEPNFYFQNDVIPAVDCGIFVDCGAFTGDTMAEFFDSPLCRCKAYYALEPDGNLCQTIRGYAAEHGLSNVRVVESAAWSEKKLLHYNITGGSNGRITESGTQEITADAIDNIVPEGEKAGFIKMDIEGSEIEALHGAEKTIKRDKPIVAASIYHKKRHLWEIPLLLHEMVPQYKIYIRHHTFTVCDTVCYAILP